MIATCAAMPCRSRQSSMRRPNCSSRRSSSAETSVRIALSHAPKNRNPIGRHLRRGSPRRAVRPGLRCLLGTRTALAKGSGSGGIAQCFGLYVRDRLVVRFPLPAHQPWLSARRRAGGGGRRAQPDRKRLALPPRGAMRRSRTARGGAAVRGGRAWPLRPCPMRLRSLRSLRPPGGVVGQGRKTQAAAKRRGRSKGKGKGSRSRYAAVRSSRTGPSARWSCCRRGCCLHRRGDTGRGPVKPPSPFDFGAGFRGGALDGVGVVLGSTLAD